MKQRLIKRLHDLIHARSMTADSAKRAALTAEIHRIQRLLDNMS